MPGKVMVALTQHRILLLLDHHAGQLVQPGQPAAVIVISTVLPVSVDLRLASVATESDQCELKSRAEAQGLGHCMELDCRPLANMRGT